MSLPPIGAHVDQTDPLAEARARQAPLVQFFLGDPQGYQGPEIAYAGGADALRDDAAAAGVDLYVHAPYIVNVATTNNRIRIPSRKLLQQHVDAAAAIGAKGLIVHGGHVGKDDDPEVGFDNWRKAIEATDLKVPLLIENTAGGDNAMTRYLERIGRRLGRHLGRRGGRHGRLLPRHLPRPRRRQRAGDRRRRRPRDHRTHRPRALQRQPRRVRLRRRPARQLRRRQDRRPTCSPPWSATPAPRSSARPPVGPTEHSADFAWLRDRL